MPRPPPDDLCLAITVANRGPSDAPLVLLPTLWFANSWSWGREGEGYLRPDDKPSLVAAGPAAIDVAHPSLGKFRFSVEAVGGAVPELVFTENETNTQRLYGQPNAGPYCKDAFHDYVVGKRAEAVNPALRGTKAAAIYRLNVPAGGELRLRLRLAEVIPERGGGEGVAPPFADFDAVVDARRAEADAFYAKKTCALAPDERLVVRQAYAGLLWTQQFYHYDVRVWLEGRSDDAAAAREPAGRTQRGVAAPLQPRRHLDARQVGVPLVRRLGSGVPDDPLRAHRSELRQGAAHPADARVVHAPERAAPGLRVRLRRREPAGARLGRLARLQDRRRP